MDEEMDMGSFDIVKFEDVKHITAEEYFAEDAFAVDIFKAKYCHTKEDGTLETPAEVFWRVAYVLSKMEKDPVKAAYFCESWFSLMWQGWFRPGGSILSGTGSNRKSSLMNCSTLPLSDDTLEAIAQCEYDTMKACAYRQGVGIDFSKLRPRGSKLGNAAVESTGVIPWMDKISKVGDYVGQVGRRPALLASLIVSHPDIEEFISSKEDLTKINNANISVQITNDFMEQVAKDGDWELRFEVKATGEVISKTVKAKALFLKIAERAHLTAEPGVQYRDLLQNGIMYKAIADDCNDERFLPHSSNACQPSFASVLTPYGIRPLGEVSVGDTIWSGKNWTIVKDKWFTGHKPVYEYHTNGGVFVGTEEHKVLQHGQKIPVGEAIAIDSCEGECPNSTLSSDFIPEFIMDGLVIGDGATHKASNFLVYLCIGTDDYDYFTSEVGPLIGTDRRRAFKCGWEITTTITAEELPKTYNREIPNRFLYGTSIEVRSFLRGLFTANGYFVAGRVCLKQTSYKLIKQVQQMLSSIGIRSYITKNKTSVVTFSNGDYKIKSSYDINISKDLEVFLNSVGFLQQYKMEALRTYVNSKEHSSKEPKATFDITTVAYLGEHDVFDITVEDEEHTYWTGGLLVSNCSEKYMAPYSVCNLSSLNMESFSVLPEKYKAELDVVVPNMVRMADNVISYELLNNLSPLPQQKWIVDQLREIGMGVTNVHGWLLKQDLAYDSDEAVLALDNFMSHYAYTVFKTSVSLGEELGDAPAFNKVKDISSYMRTTYFKNIVDAYYDGDETRINHMRNLAHMSIAPAGSLSATFPSPCVSSGIESCIGLYFWRRTRALNSGNYVYYFVMPSKLKAYVLSKIPKESPDYSVLENFSGSAQDEDGKIGLEIKGIVDKYIPKGFFKAAHEISYMQKIKLMSAVYKWMDASISCTYNLPAEATVEDVSNIYMEAYKHGVRAVSVYRDGARQGILIFEDPITNKAKFEGAARIDVCETRPTTIIPNCAPKRPDVLPCEIFHTSVNGETWVVLVGLFDEKKPFEIFCGSAEDIYLPKTCTSGKIIKAGGGKYSLEVVIRKSPVVYTDLAQTLMSDSQRALTRIISLGLRHGVPPKFIVSQMKKTNGLVTDFSKAVSRVLSKYVGTYDVKEGDNTCPKCGENSLVHSSGCIECSNPDCGYSRCG